MSRMAKITLAQLQQKAGPEVAKLLEEVTEAINQAPDGAVIAGGASGTCTSASTSTTSKHLGHQELADLICLASSFRSYA